MRTLDATHPRGNTARNVHSSRPALRTMERLGSRPCGDLGEILAEILSEMVRTRAPYPERGVTRRAAIANFFAVDTRTRFEKTS